MTAIKGGTGPREAIERIRTEDYLLDIEEESDRLYRLVEDLLVLSARDVLAVVVR